MSSKSAIEWCDATWNPVRGCTRVSRGCQACYAERVAARFSGPGMPYEGLAQMTPSGPRWTGRVRVVPEHLEDPLRWKKPRRIFVNSMSDLFHEGLSDEDIASVFRVICQSLHDRPRERRHTYQILTKRPERMVAWFAWARQNHLGWFNSRALLDLGRVWVGVSVEDQKTADERIPLLLQVPVAVRFLSCEPLLEAVDLEGPCHRGRELGLISVGAPREAAGQLAGTFSRLDGLSWVIVGAESGPGARPFDLAWAESLIRQCRAAKVACFIKQLGARPYCYDHPSGFGNEKTTLLLGKKGGAMEEWPEALRVREMPADPARAGG